MWVKTRAHVRALGERIRRAGEDGERRASPPANQARGRLERRMEKG